MVWIGRVYTDLAGGVMCDELVGRRDAAIQGGSMAAGRMTPLVKSMRKT